MRVRGPGAAGGPTQDTVAKSAPVAGQLLGFGRGSKLVIGHRRQQAAGQNKGPEWQVQSGRAGGQQARARQPASIITSRARIGRIRAWGRADVIWCAAGGWQLDERRQQLAPLDLFCVALAKRWPRAKLIHQGQGQGGHEEKIEAASGRASSGRRARPPVRRANSWPRRRGPSIPGQLSLGALEPWGRRAGEPAREPPRASEARRA